MKKKLLIGLGIVALLIGGVMVYAASNANRLVNQYKPDIERVASNTLGSKVTLGALDVNVFPSVNAKVDQLQISPKSGVGDGLTLKNLTLKFDLLPLLGGNLSIRKLTLDSPELVFLKD